MTSGDDPEALDLPPAQYLAPAVVLVEMAAAGANRSMSLSGWQVRRAFESHVHHHIETLAEELTGASGLGPQSSSALGFSDVADIDDAILASTEVAKPVVIR